MRTARPSYLAMVTVPRLRRPRDSGAASIPNTRPRVPHIGFDLRLPGQRSYRTDWPGGRGRTDRHVRGREYRALAGKREAGGQRPGCSAHWALRCCCRTPAIQSVRPRPPRPSSINGSTTSSISSTRRAIRRRRSQLRARYRSQSRTGKRVARGAACPAKGMPPGKHGEGSVKVPRPGSRGHQSTGGIGSVRTGRRYARAIRTSQQPSSHPLRL